MKRLKKNADSDKKPWYVQQHEENENIKDEQKRLITEAYNIFMKKYRDKFKDYDMGGKPEYDYTLTEYRFYVGRYEYISALGTEVFKTVNLQIRKDLTFYVKVKDGYVIPLNTNDPQTAVEEFVKEL
ncbi:MAG: hypothetical protein ACOC2W_00650 [bacterium]